jgi:hypothetical protein
MAKNYKIEDGINFFEELYKSLDNTTDDEDTKTCYCLITDELLTSNHVELKCGHKFNYVPLYNDILNHKRKLNHMEGSGLLKGNQIRCPYCRRKQDDVLPYYEEYGFPKVGGVNWQVPTYNYTSQIYHNCEFVGADSIVCSVVCATKLEADDKFYCYLHKKLMTKKHKIEALQKAKEEKEKAKEEQKKAKEEQKLKLKEEKMKLKEELKNSVKKSKAKSKSIILQGQEGEEGQQGQEGEGENVIVCGGCTEVIKTGPNKGKPCGTMVLEDGLCKRHHNLKTKKAGI